MSNSTNIWLTVGSFFSSADVNQTSNQAFNYTNLAPLQGTILTQVDESNDTSNPHPNDHLISKVIIENNKVVRTGGPPVIAVTFDPSVLPNSYSVNPLNTRSKRVSFDLYLPSRNAQFDTEETVDTSSMYGVKVFSLYWLYYTSRDPLSSSDFTVRHSGGNYWLDGLPALDRWYHIDITYDVSTNKTTYTIEDVGNKAVSGDYLSEYFTANPANDSNLIQLYHALNSGYSYYKKNNGIRLANLVFQITDTVSYDIPEFINVHIGSEICRAYSEKPIYTKGSCSYSSLVDPTVIANAVDVDNNGEHLKYSIPIVYENGSVEYITAEHPHVGAIYQNVVCTTVEFNNALNEYVISRNTEYWGISTGNNTGMQIYSELGADGPLGFQGSDTITIEFNMIISGYYYGSGIVYLGSFYNSTGSSSFSFAYRSDTKYITDFVGSNVMQNDTVKLQTSLALDTPYNFKITIHKDINTNTLYAYVYIDNNLVYSGNRLLVNGYDYTNGYFTLGFSNRVYKAKLGGFKITHGQEIKCLNVKRNNNLYYLLASNTGLYPSRLRAKIDGTTYPILLKHDGDTSE